MTSSLHRGFRLLLYEVGVEIGRLFPQSCTIGNDFIQMLLDRVLKLVQHNDGRINLLSVQTDVNIKNPYCTIPDDESVAEFLY